MDERRIFITGSTGLTGSHILRLLLLRGYNHITALRRTTSRMDLVADVADKVDWIEGDVTDAESLFEGMRGANWVIHTAAVISYDKGFDDLLYAVNAEGTANVVNAALANSVDKLLHVSSVAALNKSLGDEYIDEQNDVGDNVFTSVYGYTKYLAEMEVWRGQAEGLSTVMVNPSIILGSGYWHEGSLQIIDKVASGLRYYPVGGNGFVDVRDLARLCLKRLETDCPPGRMLANGWNMSYKELFDNLTSELGIRAPSIRVSPLMAQFAWRLLLPITWLTGRQMAITKYTAKITSSMLKYNNSLSLSLDGFSYTDPMHTIRDIAQAYMKSKEEGNSASTLPFAE